MFVGGYGMSKPCRFAWYDLFYTKISPQKVDLTHRGVYYYQYSGT